MQRLALFLMLLTSPALAKHARKVQVDRETVVSPSSAPFSTKIYTKPEKSKIISPNLPHKPGIGIHKPHLPPHRRKIAPHDKPITPIGVPHHVIQIGDGPPPRVGDAPPRTVGDRPPSTPGDRPSKTFHF